MVESINSVFKNSLGEYNMILLYNGEHQKCKDVKINKETNAYDIISTNCLRIEIHL